MRKLSVLAGVATLALLALSSSAAASSTSCNGTLTGQTISGDLVVPDGGACTIVNSTVGDDVWVGKDAFFQSIGSQIGDHVESYRSQTLFIDTGSKIGGDVEASRTAEVFVYNSTIDGPVEAWRSTQKVQVCGNTIDGGLHVHRSGPDILVGDPLTVGCPGNTVTGGHTIDVEDNFTDVELVVRGNTIQGGDLRVQDNRGPSGKFVENNTGGDELVCFGNEQPFTASGNTGWNEQRGQCAIPPTVCNSDTPLTGQTIPGDLVVPENGACTLINSTVGDDVKVGRNAFFQATGSRIGDDVRGKHAQTLFIDTGTTVGGDVESWKSAQVFVFNATLADDLEVHGSDDKVQACGNTIGGSVAIRHSARDILFGDPGTVDCAGNTVNGRSVKIEDNFTDVELVVRGNTIPTGDLRVNDNEGPSGKFVENNTGGDELVCFGNEQPFTASGNTGWDEQRGQCAVPPTECNGTLTGQAIPGDLVVPEDGACTLINSTVGDDVKVGRNAFFQATGSRIGDDVSGKHALTVFIDSGTTVGGDVETWATDEVFLFNATLNGDVGVSRSSAKVQLCGNTIDGNVRVEDSGTDILIGDPLTVGCPGNTIKNGHSMRLEDNTNDGPDGEFVVRGNTFGGGDLRVIDNEGPFPKFVQDNTGGDELKCFGNEQPFTASGNTFTSEHGQCAEV